jgi:hypothetical protein
MHPYTLSRAYKYALPDFKIEVQNFIILSCGITLNKHCIALQKWFPVIRNATAA